ncbi:MAG: hypothetical protein LBD73_03725 [Deferribacteraceae bacterium]|jgi:tetratricopeptide (TPR) repeat protein|nr:hypothetical protein [Deferribacteraceae bacterium]
MIKVGFAGNNPKNTMVGVRGGSAVLNVIAVFVVIIMVSAAVFYFFGDRIMEIIFPPVPVKITAVESPEPYRPPVTPDAEEPAEAASVETEMDDAEQATSDETLESAEESPAPAETELALVEPLPAPEPAPTVVESVPAPVAEPEAIEIETIEIETIELEPVEDSVAEESVAEESVAEESVGDSFTEGAYSDPAPAVTPAAAPKPVAAASKTSAPAVAVVPTPVIVVAAPVPAPQPKATPKPTPDVKTQYAVYITLAKNALDDGDDKEAQRNFLKAYLLVPNSEVAYNIALIYLQRNLPDRAVAWIRRVELNERDAGDLVMAMVNAGHKRAASAALSHLISQDKEGYIYYSSAYLKEFNGNIEGASKDYKTAMQRSGYDDYITYAYARSLDQLGQVSEARSYYLAVASSSNRDISSAAAQRLEVLK